MGFRVLMVLKVCFLEVLGLSAFRVVVFFFRVCVFWCLGFWGFGW